MKRLFLAILLLLLLVPHSAMARRSEIKLNIPEMGAGTANGQVVFIGEVTDNRHFEDRPAEASTPSIAEGGLKSTTAEERRFYIARVRDGYGKARNNIGLERSQPGEDVLRDLLTKCLQAKGYQVVRNKDEAGGKAIVMDVEIDELWGYIEVVAGGWSGSIPKMAGRVRTVLKVKGPGGRGRYEVSGTALHKFGFMTEKHWTLMFEELFTDYGKNLQRVDF